MDGRSGVNIIYKEMAQNLRMHWEPLTFNIRMASNCTMVLKGVVKNAKIQIVGIEYVVNLVVLAMRNLIADTYQMLLGMAMAKGCKGKTQLEERLDNPQKRKKKNQITIKTGKTNDCLGKYPVLRINLQLGRRA